MSNENDPFAGAWDDEDDTEITPRDPRGQAPGSPRSYQGAGSQNTPETPARRPRPRGVPGSADFYEEIEGEERSARPRPARQSREEVEARLRQRARQPIYNREQEDPRARQSPRRPASRSSSPGSTAYPQAGASRQAPRTRDFAQGEPRPTRDFSASRSTRDFSQGAPRPTRDFSERAAEFDDDYGDEYTEIDIIEERPPARRPYPPRRGRRVFRTLLTGCLGGLLTLLIVAGVLVFLVLHNTPLGQTLGSVGKTAYKQTSQQPLVLGTNTQIIVKDSTGNVTVKVDPNTSAATLSSVKHVLASSQSEANTQLKTITLSVTTIVQSADPACLVSSCLLINATVPTTSGGGLFGGNNGTSIDLAITLPASFNSSNPLAPNTLTASAGAGTIGVSGFNGVLNLNSTAGNITVAHSLIYAGTCVQTLHGDIAIAQQSIFDLATASKYVPCSNTVSNDAHRPWFNVKSGVGNVSLTLTTNLSNLLLDANTNDGHITDDFNLNVTSDDGSDTYHGPLVPGTSPTASLYVATSTGNIILHKQ